MIQYYIRIFRPTFLGLLTKLLYSSKNIKFGNKLKCDTVPRILIDKKSSIAFGNNVFLRRNVEIRAHGTSKINIKNNIQIDRGVRILSANKSKITISDRVKIGLYSVINGGDDVFIGEKVLISGFVYIQTSMHKFNDKELSIQDQGFTHLGVVLGKDVWLGTHVVVMPGVEIKKGSIIGSNAVVTKSVKEYKIMTGIPAKEIKLR